jgi:hypothetical protein
MMSRAQITNLLLFQLGWFACVLGGAYGQVVLGSMIAIAVIGYHFYRAADAIQELRLLLLALIMGIVFESIITAQGLARYSHGQVFDYIAPLWMILMWPLFATTLNLSMRWLKGLAPVLIAIIGAVFAPLAYYAGNRLGAVEYDHFNLSIGLIAVAWAALLPALVTISIKLDGYSASPAEPGTREYARHV